MGIPTWESYGNSRSREFPRGNPIGQCFLTRGASTPGGAEINFRGCWKSSLTCAVQYFLENKLFSCLQMLLPKFRIFVIFTIYCVAL